uniref:Protein ygiW n=1 Tax=Aliivibrio fischeri TaxID=668 RepID=H2ES66_ALIFS|nr:NirD/YgiW/YdeI family stress tolerance protein [Aliivibrio fischeri]AEY78233.1 Protein ygiW precursor [Aliivibrio fischeri]
MKKIILLAALVSSSVFANNHVINQPVNAQQGGFSGPTQGINTVKSVLDAGMFSDDTPVSLTGYLVASLGGEMYTFKDNTGTIHVEIDHDKWFGLQATPTTKITIYGDIDKEFNYTKVDVDRVSLAQ